MSYDLYLLRKDEVGDDPSAAYERLEEQEEREPTPDEERQLRQLAVVPKGADEVSTKALTATMASTSSGRITRALAQRPPGAFSEPHRASPQGLRAPRRSSP